MKTYFLLPVLALVLFAAPPAFAEDDITPSPSPGVTISVTPTPKPRLELRQRREELKDQAEDAREQLKEQQEKQKELRLELKEQLKQKRNELKEKAKELISEIRTNRAQKTAAKVRARLVARFDFLVKMKATLAAKIVKLEAANDTATKKRDLTAAKAQLAKFDPAKYQAALVQLDAVIAKIGTTDKPMTIIPEINQAAKAVNAQLKSLHEVLVATVKAIAQSGE